MHTLRYVSTRVCGRMRNSSSTLVYAEYVRDKFYEHATERWYTLSYGEEIPKFCVCIKKNLQRIPTHCLCVRHK